MADAQPRWMLAPPGGPQGPCWGIVEPATGRTVAAAVADESDARLFLAARELRDSLAYLADAWQLPLSEWRKKYGKNAKAPNVDVIVRDARALIAKAEGGS